MRVPVNLFANKEERYDCKKSDHKRIQAALACAHLSPPASRPLVESIILRHSPGSVRATILSVDNLIFLLLLAFTEPVAGIIGDTYSLSVAFILMGVGVGVAISILIPLWRRMWKADLTVAS
jgi:hypothetical protein